MKQIFNSYKTYMSLVLLVIVASCSNSQLTEDTQPTLEHPRGSIGPVLDMVVSVDYPRGFDRLAFQNEYGPQLGLTLVYSCPTNPDRELWVVDQLTEAEFEDRLEQLFTVIISETQSNGNGGYQTYAKYNSNSGNNSNATSAPDLNEEPVLFGYNGSCF